MTGEREEEVDLCTPYITNSTSHYIRMCNTYMY